MQSSSAGKRKRGQSSPTQAAMAAGSNAGAANASASARDLSATQSVEEQLIAVLEKGPKEGMTTDEIMAQIDDHEGMLVASNKLLQRYCKT